MPRPKRLTAEQHAAIDESYRERGRAIAMQLIDGSMSLWRFNSLWRIGMTIWHRDAIMQELIDRARERGTNQGDDGSNLVPVEKVT